MLSGVPELWGIFLPWLGEVMAHLRRAHRELIAAAEATPIALSIAF
jgi:hypothetical protein